MIAIVDYGMGNLRSVQKALEKVGGTTIITQSPNEIINCDKLVLPGVGAMKPAMEKLQTLNLIEPIKDFVKSGKTFFRYLFRISVTFFKKR